ncbi:putative Microtubule-associated protein RP/EB family member 1 [Blattamonas nauphoetae]|uniref:Microtubule-associated protein RP/EB family member 1 n=1 Tax=Blattamonas nauphoetae TaxID=2049346 RepID=A0ABQ9Y4P1_9EUKA|nr:putative Microtubule-associated protein RP/EB family member 1 [Blattamonas nauphoetae]
MADRAIGNMDGAYFISRTELLNWVNETLQLNYAKLDLCSNGAAFAQIVDVIFPGKVPMGRINWNAKYDYEFEKNYKIIQDTFTKVGVDKVIDVARLCKGKFQDTLEFAQWLKRFYDLHIGSGGRAGYDPAARRQGKALPAELVGDSARSTGGSQRGASPKRAGSRPSHRTDGNTQMLESEVTRLTDLNNELKETMDGIEKERNFYFEKLRKVEIICQEKENDPIMKQILDILYATEGDFVAGDEDQV